MPLLSSRMVQSLLLLGIGTINPFFKYLRIFFYSGYAVNKPSDSSGSNEATIFQVLCCYHVPSRDLSAFQFHDTFMHDIKIGTLIPDFELVNIQAIWEQLCFNFPSKIFIEFYTVLVIIQILIIFIPFPMNIIRICTKLSGVI